jgi:DNA-binding NtrC family response regulator
MKANSSRLGGKASFGNVRLVALRIDLSGLSPALPQGFVFPADVADPLRLRERREDIRPLLEYFLQTYNRQTGAEVQGFTEEAINCLVAYDWPGNVRELKNSIESVFIDPPHPRIDTCHLMMSNPGLQRVIGMSTERDQLLDALKTTHWNKSRAAEKLRWSRMKIYRKINKYSIEDREQESEVPPFLQD